MNPSPQPPRQIWLICGCDSPFGHYLVQTVLRYGDTVIATAPDVTALRHLQGLGATLLPLDITECPTELDRKIRTVVSRFGRIDVVVQNAGLGPLGVLQHLR